MSSIERYPVEPKYQKENGLYVIDSDDLPFPADFRIAERSIVRIPAGQVAGNHRHPRLEAYVTCDDVTLVWVDENGERHMEAMGEASGLALFVVRSMVPHAVVNHSQSGATIIGFADGPLVDVEPMQVAEELR
jgi:uncharacterized RmlC-like cupin family protein